MDSIEKLREKVAKDPSSKLFVPLAEEYRKAGKLDEAVEVLKAGLERQPSYMSARVALSKIYLEKNMLAEARNELEKVIQSIPDNLFAQRKLADIYKQMGDTQKAIAQYKTVLRLNPLDEEALGILKTLEAGTSTVSEAAPEATEAVLETTAFAETEPLPEQEAIEGLETFHPTKEQPLAEEEAFEIPAEETKEEEIETGVFTIESPEEAVSEELSFEGIPEEEEAVYTLEGIEEIEKEAEPQETFNEELSAFVAGFSPEVQEQISAPEAPETAEALSPAFEESAPFEEPLPEAEGSAEGIMLSDLLVQKGDYAQAARTLEGILKQEPENRAALQRLQELKALLKLLGREHEIVISRLNAFLDGIRKRRDEFYGNA